jgi:hypothetical protein
MNSKITKIRKLLEIPIRDFRIGPKATLILLQNIFF